MHSLLQKMLATQDPSIKTLPFPISAVNFDIHIENKQSYQDFINSVNGGGLFFNRSFQLYGYNNEPIFTNGNYIHQLIQDYFGKLSEKVHAFGQDIFGHQFAFVKGSPEIVHFNAETGEIAVIAHSFNDWISAFENKLDYYTGAPLMDDWIAEKGPIPPDARLVPIKPFVIGGEFEVSNLHLLPFPQYLSYYADIARQISSIADGTQVKIVLKN